MQFQLNLLDAEITSQLRTLATDLAQPPWRAPHIFLNEEASLS
jgi:hypothetical protein